MITYIYALHDPRDKAVKYVGKTVNINSRVKDHYRIGGLERHGRNVAKRNWVKEIRTFGLRPLCCVLEVVEGNGEEAEKKWIKHYRDSGVKLLNSLAGGQGRGWYFPAPAIAAAKVYNTGRKLSEEHKARIAEGLKRYKQCNPDYMKVLHTPEVRAKVSASLKGRKTGPCSDRRREAIRASKKARWDRLSSAERQQLLDRLRTPEVRAKSSETAKKGWIKRKLGIKNYSAEKIS